jgi:lipooligosaccharide transport system permease protein
MLPTHRALRVWHRNLQSWKRYAPAFLVATLGEPIFLLFAVGYGLGRFVPPVDGVPYVAFLLPGLISTNAMYSASFETTFGSFTRMSEQHTLPAIPANPCSVADVVAGDILWAATRAGWRRP